MKKRAGFPTVVMEEVDMRAHFESGLAVVESTAVLISPEELKHVRDKACAILVTSPYEGNTVPVVACRHDLRQGGL